MKTIWVPFAYERYGRLPVQVEDNATSQEIIEAGNAALKGMSVSDMDSYAEYLENSEEIDEEGVCQDDDGNFYDFEDFD